MWFFVSKDLRRSYSRPTTVPFATVSMVSLFDDCEYVCTLPAIIPYARVVASSMERLGPTSPKTTSPVAFRIWCCDLSAEWWLIGRGTMRESVSPYPLPIASTGFHNACKRQVRVCTVSTVWLWRVSVCSMWLFLVCVALTTHLSPRTLHSHTCLQETVVNGKQKGKCTKGAACSFHHDETKRGKSTRSFSLSCVPFGIPRLSSAASSSSAAPPSTLSSSQDSSRTGIYAKTGEKKN